jgi:hypothetical protein
MTNDTSCYDPQFEVYNNWRCTAMSEIMEVDLQWLQMTGTVG